MVPPRLPRAGVAVPPRPLVSEMSKLTTTLTTSVTVAVALVRVAVTSVRRVFRSATSVVRVLVMVWTVIGAGDKWSVAGAFFDKDKPVGAWTGKDVAVADGKLTFVRGWNVKPVPDWADDLAVTAELVGDKLTYSWRAGVPGSVQARFAG